MAYFLFISNEALEKRKNRGRKTGIGIREWDKNSINVGIVIFERIPHWRVFCL
jgi:hypothetical protein